MFAEDRYSNYRIPQFDVWDTDTETSFADATRGLRLTGQATSPVNTHHSEKRENPGFTLVYFRHSTNPISSRDNAVGLAGFKPAFSCLRWGMCRSYPDSA